MFGVYRVSPSAEKFSFIIGAMKCGTTALYGALSQHPQICPCKKKEPEFFSHDETYDCGVDWYRNLWESWNPATHRVALDATTSYTKSPGYPHAARRIHEFNPAARLIYLVRNPFERIRSHYQMSLVKGWGVRPLENGVDEDAISLSKYCYQLDRYLEYFPRESILVIASDRLQNEPQAVLSEICGHLDVDGSISLRLDKRHVSNKHYLLPHIERRMKLDGVIDPGASVDAVAGHVRSLPVDAQKDLLNRASKEFCLTEANQSQIRDALEHDMQRLCRDYGVDVGRWGF